MRCLLQEDGIRSVDFTHVYRHFLLPPAPTSLMSDQTDPCRSLYNTHQLLRRKDRVHDGDIGRREIGRDGEDEDTGVDVGGGVFWGVGGGWDVGDAVYV